MRLQLLGLGVFMMGSGGFFMIAGAAIVWDALWSKG